MASSAWAVANASMQKAAIVVTNWYARTRWCGFIKMVYV